MIQHSFTQRGIISTTSYNCTSVARPHHHRAHDRLRGHHRAHDRLRGQILKGEEHYTQKNMQSKANRDKKLTLPVENQSHRISLEFGPGLRGEDPVHSHIQVATTGKSEIRSVEYYSSSGTVDNSVGYSFRFGHRQIGRLSTNFTGEQY